MFRARRLMRRRAIARSGGAAYHAARRGAQAGQEEQTPEGYEAGPTPEASADPMGQLEELAELQEQGILTAEEFAAEKKKLLGA
jgi:hypothetical protein